MGLGVALLSAPLQVSVYPFTACEGLVGLFGAGIEVACNTWILEMWQQDANPLMQGMFLSYAIAQCLAPLMLEPFLSLPMPSGNHTVNDHPSTRISSESRILIPYSFITALLCSCGLLLIVIQYKYPYMAPSTLVHGVEDNLARGRVQEPKAKRNKTMTIILACVFMFFHTHVQAGSLTFISIFACNTDLHLTKSTATFMASAMGGAYAIARGVSVLVATRVKVDYMLYTSLAIVMTGNILLTTFANTSEVMIWIAIVLMGAGFASLVPGLFSLVQQRIDVTNQVCGVIACAAPTCGIISALVLGSVAESNSMLFPYLNVGSTTATFLALIALHFSDKLRRLGSSCCG